MSNRIDRLIGTREQRRSTFELRDSDPKGLVLEGYASVFDHPYEVAGGPAMGGWMEIVDRHAFDKTLSTNPEVHLLLEHEGLTLAYTGSRTLELSTDKRGLKTVAYLDPSDPDVQRVIPKVRAGNLKEMSFAFRTVRQEWNEQESERRLLEVNIHKGDVSLVNYGANDATEAGLRSFDDALKIIRNAQPEFAEIRNNADLLAAIRDAQSNLGQLARKMLGTTKPLSVAEAEALLEI